MRGCGCYIQRLKVARSDVNKFGDILKDSLYQQESGVGDEGTVPFVELGLDDRIRNAVSPSRDGKMNPWAVPGMHSRETKLPPGSAGVFCSCGSRCDQRWCAVADRLPLTNGTLDALEVAKGRSGQSARVANFLLAWHNAEENGGWTQSISGESTRRLHRTFDGACADRCRTQIP